MLVWIVKTGNKMSVGWDGMYFTPVYGQACGHCPFPPVTDSSALPAQARHEPLAVSTAVTREYCSVIFWIRLSGPLVVCFSPICAGAALIAVSHAALCLQPCTDLSAWHFRDTQEWIEWIHLFIILNKFCRVSHKSTTEMLRAIFSAFSQCLWEQEQRLLWVKRNSTWNHH